VRGKKVRVEGLKVGSLSRKQTYALIVAFSLAEALTHFGNANPIRSDPALDFDSPFYVHMLYYLKGLVKRPPSSPFNMRPLVPMLALPLSYLVGVNNAFGVVNTAFWILTAIALYRLVESLFRSWEVAIISSILFSSSVPALVYGAAISTDMAGLFLITIGLLLALRARSVKAYVFEGLLVGVGVLAREPVSILVPTIALMRLLEKPLSIKRTTSELLIVCLIASVPLLAYWWIIPEPNYTAYFAGNVASAFTTTKLLNSLKQVILTYHIGYLYVAALPVRKELRFNKAVYAILVSTVGFLIFDYFVGLPSSRFIFLTAPVILPLMATGARGLSHRLMKGSRPEGALMAALLALYILSSNVGTANKNLCFPSLNDEPIARLLPPLSSQ